MFLFGQGPTSDKHPWCLPPDYIDVEPPYLCNQIWHPFNHRTSNGCSSCSVREDGISNLHFVFSILELVSIKETSQSLLVEMYLSIQWEVSTGFLYHSIDVIVRLCDCVILGAKTCD